jgi:hypothetical protein
MPWPDDSCGWSSRSPLLDFGVVVGSRTALWSGVLPAPPAAVPAATITSAELAVGVAVVGVALLAWAGLALAHAGHYSLAAAAAAALGAGAGLALVAWRAPGRPRLVLDPGGLAMVAGVGVLAAFLFLPGFPYGAGDKDPGVYTSHGVAIARTGSYLVADPAADRTRVPAPGSWSPGARFPGLWIDHADPRRLVPQFYHLWPALLASGYATGGLGLLANVGPCCGVLAVLVAALAARRAFGLLAGTLAGVLLAANMLQVWQAKYPTAEIFTQLLVSGALLAVVVALQTGWRPAAGLSGLLLGLAFLARPDSLLLVLLAVAGLGVLLAVDRLDARAGWFAAGLAVTVPHGLLQGYRLARSYTMANAMPSLPAVVAVVAGTLLLATAVRLAVPGPGWQLVRQLGRRRGQLRAGLLVVAVAAGLLAVGFLRPKLFGPAFMTWNGRRLPSYDEYSLHRLAWFFTLPGFALMAAGLALVSLRRWRAAAWAVVVPALCLLPLYAWHANNSSRLMWWGRRFVPAVVPGLAVLLAVALGAGLLFAVGPARVRLAVRAATAVATAWLFVVFLGQSLPLRAHHEFAGSFELARRVALAAGDRPGIFLWQRPSGRPGSPAALLGGPVWLQQGQLSALLPRRPDPGYVRSFARGFPGHPLFLVWDGDAPPAGYAPLGLHRVGRVDTSLPAWDESDIARPSGAHPIPIRFSIWQLAGT